MLQWWTPVALGCVQSRRAKLGSYLWTASSRNTQRSFHALPGSPVPFPIAPECRSVTGHAVFTISARN